MFPSAEEVCLSTYSVDLERAFRNLRVDPYDYPLMGLCWNNDV